MNSVVPIVFEDKVRRLDIAVDYIIVMKVLYSHTHLPHEVSLHFSFHEL